MSSCNRNIVLSAVRWCNLTALSLRSNSASRYFLTPLSFFVLLFLVLSTSNAAATQSIRTIPSDTDEVAEQEYDINDPRNPNCPCHQYQKQADEEYQRMQQQQANTNSDKDNDASEKPQDNPDDQNNHEQESQDDSDHSDGNVHVKPRLRLPDTDFGKGTRKLMRRIGRKHNGTRKWRRSVVDCFRWD